MACSNKNYKKGMMAILLLVVMFFVCSLSYAYTMSTPVPSVIITSENVSYEEKVPGSWQVEKSAKWISKGRARVTLDVDTVLMVREDASDIIFVVDTSGSMEGDKLDQVKIDSTNLINDILSNTNNRVSLIEFNSSATILSDFTNDKDLLINEINGLQVSNSTNYYNAFLKVDELLQSYQKQDSREVVMMFLTDGYPYEGNPNQIAEYKYLKEAYLYLTVNAIQYEMGGVIINQLKEVSDNQYLAFQDNLDEILSEASITPTPYDEFQIIDYVDNDYYNLNSVDDIKVSDGEVKLEEENGTQKITWTIPNYLSGRKVKLTMDLSLKDEYIGQGGVYPTNKKEEVISKIENQSEDVSSNLTPTLAEKYQVIYDGNAPEGSSVENIPNSEAQSVFDTVEITEEEPTCKGFIFQGWEIVTDNVKKIGSDYFIMPEVNVTLRAKWSKIELAKSMDGVVSEQGDPIMKGSDWWMSEYDKADVTSIEIKTNTDIPDTAIYSWDASQAGDMSVVAYLEDDGSGNGTYKVTIGGRGGVIANSNSFQLFSDFTKMENILLNNLDTSNVSNMYQMFNRCNALEKLNVNSFNTSNVTNMRQMFLNCTSLVELDISNFDTSKVIDMGGIFNSCNSLRQIDLSNFDTSSVVNMEGMFLHCYALTSLDLFSFDTSNVTTMSSMFAYSRNLERLDLSNFNTSNVTNMLSMFHDCSSLIELDVTNFNTSKVTEMQSMFNTCSSLVNLDISSFDTSNVVNMGGMFYRCSSLTQLNVDNFDTSKVINMESMFDNCTNITNLDVSHFNTSNVENMRWLFRACYNLTSLNLSTFDTSKVTDMVGMFNNCQNLISLDINHFNTTNVTNMDGMFANCFDLQSLDLSSFDTSNVENMSQLFYNCRSLTVLNLENAVFDSVTVFTNMFNGASNLEVIVKDEEARVWIQDKLGSNGTVVIVSV